MTKQRRSNKKPKAKKGKKVLLPDAPFRLNRIEFIPNRTLYDRDFHPQSFIQFCREGRSRSYICAAWSISESTLSSWFRDYEEMANARNVGAQAYKAYYEEIAHDAIVKPKSFGYQMLQFYLKNKCGWAEDGGRNDHDDVDLGVQLDIVAV
jgi:transposase-like protein